MDDELLIRVYSVGFGDCIYVRIPDNGRHYHLLIDCGTSASADPKKNPNLKNVVDDLLSMLPPDAEGKKRLDLLVATHPHADHIKGFDPEWFQEVKIGRIWMSAFMKEDHPQARGAQALQALTDSAARTLLERPGLHLGPGVEPLLRRGIGNEGAMNALRQDLNSEVEPLYVSRDIARRLTAAQRKKHQLRTSRGTSCLRDFQERGTCLRVLAPEWDIDGYYLGKAADDFQSLLARDPLHTEEHTAAAREIDFRSLASAQEQAGPTPRSAGDAILSDLFNVSATDFWQLRNRLLYSALAFSQEDDELKNNTSVVLLLEWRGRRLLFAADAEWAGGKVEKGRRNGCWDVLLFKDEGPGHLSQPLDFLKVGHHASINGTPFVDEAAAEQKVLDRFLPVGGNAHVVVSTVAGKHGDKYPVPYRNLLIELGRRAANKRRYSHDTDPELRDVYQPQRTDLEALDPEKEANYVDVTFDPAPGWSP